MLVLSHKQITIVYEMKVMNFSIVMVSAWIKVIRLKSKLDYSVRGAVIPFVHQMFGRTTITSALWS